MTKYVSTFASQVNIKLTIIIGKNKILIKVKQVNIFYYTGKIQYYLTRKMWKLELKMDKVQTKF